jgi:hypothetical protein
LQEPPKFTRIGIFGLKIYHLATLPTIVGYYASAGKVYNATISIVRLEKKIH